MAVNSILDWLNSLLDKNNDYRAGTAPLGRNIYGEAGYVDTHFPRTRSTQLDPQGVWFDRDKNTATFTAGGEVYPLNFDNWNKIINPNNEGDALSDEDYWGLIDRLKKHGFFNRSEIPFRTSAN